ncbi:MAG TPA: type IV pilus secretin PilQ, partial [Leucothrix sp.]|nr:type IV pilus secretin PilQ [Leucothrix sp.]
LKLIESAGKGKKDASLMSSRGSISVDARTNTLLVQDMSSRVNDIRSLVKTLDVPVRQVSIESRIVYATDEFGKELGARFGATKIGGKGAFSGGIGATDSMVNDLIGGNSGSIGVPSLTDRLSVNMPVVGAAGSLAFSLLSKDYLLDLELSALQAENKGEVISSPRVVTADKRKAVIEKGVEVPYEVESLSGGTTIAFKKAVLGLEVTPQITPDEHIIMNLLVRQDEINKYYQSSRGNSIPIIDTRNVTTQVLVDNGQTVVLGGVHEETKSNDVRKVPMLGDLPVIGNLFKKTAKKTVKRELLIFVTPKILR